MKCTVCVGDLNPRHVWCVVLYTPNPHVGNIHPTCMAALLGSAPARKLSNLVLTAGWTQPLLPNFERSA